MRRWLAIFLLVLLPFQFSWAAVANCCADESDASVHHAGHHTHAGHDHDGAAADTGDKNGEQGGGETPAAAQDCGHGHCHGHCVGMLQLPRAFAALAPREAPPPGRTAAPTEPLLAQPERPQWAPLA